MNAVKLYQKYTIEQLQEMNRKLTEDPKNKNSDLDSIWIYNKKTQKKLNDIAWAITYHLRDKRKAEGKPVNDAGYTGKNHK